MLPLQKIHATLHNPEICRYSTHASYPVDNDGEILEKHVLELLELGITYPKREHVLIGYFGNSRTVITYAGEDAESMKKTMHSLRLPNSWPSSLGEKVFYLFRGHLKHMRSGPVSLQQDVIPGNEHQLEFVLQKLLQVYQRYHR